MGSRRWSTSDNGVTAQLIDKLVTEPPIAQGRGIVLPDRRRRTLNGARRRGEPRRRSRLNDACEFDEGLPRAKVTMVRRLVHLQHRGEACIGFFKDGAPLGPRLPCD